MIKTIHIKLLLLFSLSILFGHSALGQDQHVCADATALYSGGGGNTSIMNWYLDVVDATPDFFEDLSSKSESAEYPGYYFSIYSITWTNAQIGDHTITMVENNGTCDSKSISRLIRVHSIPSNPTATLLPIACNRQTGSILANITAIAPTGLILQVRLVDGTNNAIAGQDWTDVSGITHDLTGLSAGIYKVQLRYTFSGVEVRGSLVSSDMTYTLTNPAALELSKSITKVTCAGGIDGAIDLTVTGGEGTALNFNGTSGGIQINSWSPLYNTSQFTVEGWVKLNSGSSYASGQYSLFGQNNTVEFGIDGGNLQGWVQTRTGDPYSVNYPIVGNLNDDQFHHLAFSGNRDNLILYVDGIAVQNLPVSISVGDFFGGSTGGYLRIGTGVFDGGTDDPFDGEISHVRFWNEARTPAQILAGMSQLMIGSESGLLGAYTLSEGNGTTISGVGSFANDGTLASGVSWVLDAALYTYLWTKQADASFTATSQDLSDLSSGIYKVTVSNPNGCTISDDNIEVGVKLDNEVPKINNLLSNQEVCADIDSEGKVLTTAVVNGIGVTDVSDNCTAVTDLIIQFKIDAPDDTYDVNYGAAADASGYLFPIGINTVTYKVTDGAGLSSESSFTITIYERPNLSEITTDL